MCAQVLPSESRLLLARAAAGERAPESHTMHRSQCIQCSVHHSNRCTVCATGELYGYGHTNVLFKPTKAADEPFRPTPESAMSYFVGGTAVENGLEEDAGFAINGPARAGRRSSTRPSEPAPPNPV